ncbi:3-deoxy-D-manno-octulosonic acid transferase [Pacificoceanicola onchidii]|uniref:3-deoxy-D-manno-octulosonic acid transferase n=1 Tax=Pacificoceanicola onchidii TaxID=2562685 RepID=UPI001F0E02E7|nr:glycosyltransferase N-terminal domain-containing protein [Pacificoceanicola onchidii]
MSKRALSLQAYLTYARSGMAFGSPGSERSWPEPGPGPVIWAHADGADHGRALVNLCSRIAQQHPDAQIYVSGADVVPPDMQKIAIPPERIAECERFVARLRPDLCLWGASDLRPALLHSMQASGGQTIALPPPGGPWRCAVPRWLPDPTPATMAVFNRIHAANVTEKRQLRRAGVPADIITVSGPLTDTGTPLDCDDGQYEEVAAALAGRPVWLAARLRACEASDVLRAHRRATRLAHRLLLIVVPASEEDFFAIERCVADQQLRVCNWDAGESPDDNTMVLLVEGPEEIGLWYRAAPLAFLGGSMTSGHGGTDPFEAAALGTAILYGPNVSNHLPSYSRLVEAGAARIVRDADSLASAVSNLVAPDQAATMAHAGWDAVTAGADLIDTVLADVAAHLDREGSP